MDTTKRKPLKRQYLPECFGRYKIWEPSDPQEGCQICFVTVECVRKTSGKTDREIVYLYEDLERFKSTCYQDAVELGLIHPSNKPEHLLPIHLWKAMAGKLKEYANNQRKAV